jgi:hypothetical protein
LLFPCFGAWPRQHKILRADRKGVKYCYFWWQHGQSTVVQLIVASESAQHNMYIRYATLLPCFPDGNLSEAISIPKRGLVLVIKSSYNHSTGPYRTFSDIPPWGVGVSHRWLAGKMGCDFGPELNFLMNRGLSASVPLTIINRVPGRVNVACAGICFCPAARKHQPVRQHGI